MFLFKRDEAMTKWWIKLSIIVLFIEIVSPFIQPFICFIKGICAISACCVCVGYYVFVIIYNFQNEPHLMREFYVSQELENIMTFPTYVLLDTSIHVCVPVYMFYNWHSYVTVGGTIIAFLFHRFWSLVNSNFTSFYLVGDKIYNLKEVIWWGWPIIYASEATVLILGTILAFYLQQFE
jgi:hypothetical protein